MSHEGVGPIPDHWVQTTLGQICYPPQYGWTTSAKDQPTGLRLLRTTDITHGPPNWSTVPACAEEPEDRDRYLLADGDVVISRAGSVGASAVVRNPPAAVFASYLIRFRPREEALSSYLGYYLQSPDYWLQVKAGSAGIALQNLNAKKLAAFEMPLAPLGEQRRIVEAIEFRFARLDAAVRALERARANLKRYRASTLGHFCSSERRTSIENVVDMITDGEHQVPPRSPSGVAFISARNVKDGRVELGEMDYISVELHKKITRRLKPAEGDVLISCSGTVGKCALVPAGLECSLNRSVAIVRPRRSRMVPAFLMYSLLSPDGQSQISSLKKQTAQANLFQGSIRQIEVPDLNLDQQAGRVGEIERRLSIADEAAAEVELGLRRSIRLRESILSRAFEGYLVPQDPHDEPASALLDRTKAAKPPTSKPLRRARRRPAAE